MPDSTTIPPERLMDAVDAIYIAVAQAGPTGLSATPSVLMGTQDQPQVFCAFTWHEIREAEMFLVRCGLLRILDEPDIAA